MSEVESKAHGVRATRPDYGMQVEILVSYIYHMVVNPGDHVVDGGANIGTHTVPLSNLVSASGRVHAFEPNSSLLNSLSLSLADVGSLAVVQVYCAALSDHTATAEFLVNNRRPSYSHLMRNGELPSDSGGSDDLIAIRVPAVRLDDVLNSSHKISFVKLDLEGADFLAIRGARKIIERDAPMIVFEHTQTGGTSNYGYTPNEFFSFFDEIGYDVFNEQDEPLTAKHANLPVSGIEAYCGRRGSLPLARVRTCVNGFWAKLDSRRILQNWGETRKIVRNPFEYLLG